MMTTLNKKKALFLDRDGVINRETGTYIYKPEDFELNAGILEALEIFRERGFMLIVISNQGGIGQNIYKQMHVEKLHAILKEQLSGHGIELSEIYYCPHHPVSGKCLCRKPGSLMIEKAIARFNIDPSLSYMIGDRERDIIAAEKAGVKGILINSNESLLNYVEKII
jgi:D-glycero-D-manno-heptose 1,7-bisphosphate phosphatase